MTQSLLQVSSDGSPFPCRLLICSGTLVLPSLCSLFPAYLLFPSVLGSQSALFLPKSCPMPAAWLCWHLPWGEGESAWCPFACKDIGLCPGKAEGEGVGGFSLAIITFRQGNTSCLTSLPKNRTHYRAQKNSEACVTVSEGQKKMGTRDK